MSIRQAMLALLQEQPMHGYQLRQEFEARTGGTWPLNIGQAYSTLQRLERDGLVEPVTAVDGDGGDGEPERFRLTAEGRAEASAWWASPVERGAPARDELAIKLALAVTVPDVDVEKIVRTQRTETMRALQDYTRLKRRAATDAGTATGSADLAWSLVLDSLVFQSEAEMRWLDHVEGRVLAAGPAGRTTRGADGAHGAHGARDTRGETATRGKAHR
jgi:DNA-binding PadR family transcriptional regulator